MPNMKRVIQNHNANLVSKHTAPVAGAYAAAVKN